MAAISKRTSGYQVQIRRRGFPAVSRMFKTKRDAEAWARQLEGEMDRGAYLDRTEAENTTLGELLTRYQQEVTPHKKSAFSEAKRIERMVRDESICKYKTTALTGKLLADYRDTRLRKVKSPRNL